MVVCICAGVTEKEIRCAIRESCKTFRALQKKYNIGNDCCVCVTKVKALLEETK